MCQRCWCQTRSRLRNESGTEASKPLATTPPRRYGRRVPHPPRTVDPNGIYHVVARGNDRRAIFLTDQDRTRFGSVLARSVERCAWQCLAYCLMTNHYHLVVAVPTGELSAGMRDLNGGYARIFNARHGCEGHLFRNRFRYGAIERDGHLLEACRYVVLNPVRARLCVLPEAWPWSSYRACAGLEWAPRFLADRQLLRFFGRSPATARRRYRAFVADARHQVSDTVTKP